MIDPARAVDRLWPVLNRLVDVHAEVADPAERARLWAKALAVYAPYASYQERAEREIPLVVLRPTVVKAPRQ